MALFRNFGVNRRNRLCGIPVYASAQFLDFLELAKNCTFLDRKLISALLKTADRHYLRDSMATNEKTPETSESRDSSSEQPDKRVKFEIYGEEMIEKSVKSSGNSGRVYLPPNWVGHQVKIIRID
jgi:putative transposon-encoded protein